MEGPEETLHALHPWLQWLQRGQQSPPGAEAAALLTRAEQVLARLALGEVAVPAWIAADEQVLDSEGRLRDRRPARAVREMREDREAVLRLGIWGALGHLRAEGIEPGFDGLMARISEGPFDPPPLQPGHTAGAAELLAFAHSAEAARFFNGRLKPLLANLARLYDPAGARFARWLDLPEYTPGASDIARWAQAWTVAAVATYLDWLRRASGDSMEAALQRVWAGGGTRFRAPRALLQREPDDAGTRPAALPTDDDRLHFELLLPLVLAQVIEHDPGRWQQLREGARRFVVALSMKTLDQADSRRHDPAHAGYRHVTVYRGLTILQIYMAAAIDGLCQLQPRGAR